ncbi:MAG TPA: ABC-type transport auxiliary lipoprotein family protein [Stellaceae bacterium]|nr:ABC-type transport auxiliary lipoprotein family protein [Stellaceae bacterium]
MNGLHRRLLLSALLVAPSGCGSLLPTGGAPPKLYTLTPATDFPAGQAIRSQLLVDVPVSAAALDTERIALSRSAITIDYYAEAAWTDRAPLMIQSLVVQSFENSGRITAIGRESLALRADYVLRPELRHFEAEYHDAAAPSAHVAVGIKLVKMPDRTIVAQRNFEAAAPALANQMPAIVESFDKALHDAMRQIVDWTLTTVR